MKKAGSYALLFILLISNTSLNQVFKIPALYDHFLEHHTLDNRVSLMDFLSMHYWGTDLNDNDTEKDMKLPLKRVDCQAGYQIASPAPRTIIEKPQTYPVKINWPIFQNYNLLQPALDALFRPPRV